MIVQPKMVSKDTKSNTKPKMAGNTMKANEKKIEPRKNTAPAEKRKLDQTKYAMSFGNIYDGFCEMVELSYDINDLTREISELIPETVDEAIDMLLHIFTAHMPSYDNRKNMHYDINVSANKCSLKTDRFISFGWYIKNTKQEDSSYVTEFIFHITTFGDKGNLSNELLNHGWSVDTYNK